MAKVPHDDLPTEEGRHYDTAISLRIRHPDIDPGVITSGLNLEPDGAYRPGEPHRTRSGKITGRIHKESFWHKRLSEASYPPASLTEELERQVAMLTPHRAVLRKIQDGGGEVEFFIGWFFWRNSGDVIGPELMARLAELGIALSFDIYAQRPSEA